MAQCGKWQLSAWCIRGLDSADERHFSDAGVNVQRVRLNVTAHVGRNKLDRRPGFEAGVRVAGGPRSEYVLLTAWVIYWTLNIGATWHEKRYAASDAGADKGRDGGW